MPLTAPCITYGTSQSAEYILANLNVGNYKGVCMRLRYALVLSSKNYTLFFLKKRYTTYIQKKGFLLS